MEQVLKNHYPSKGSFTKYIKNNRWPFIIGGILLFLVYGSQLYTINARVDTETVINDPHSTYNWLIIGRQV